MQEPDIHKLTINIQILIISQNKKRKKRVSSFSSITASLLESHSNIPKAIEQYTHDATVATITSESTHLVSTILIWSALFFLLFFFSLLLWFFCCLQSRVLECYILPNQETLTNFLLPLPRVWLNFKSLKAIDNTHPGG